MNETGGPIVQFTFLFNTVLHVALKDDLANWQRKSMGTCLGDSETDCLNNLRFADDVLLFSTWLEQSLRTMCDFKRSTERVGLTFHQEKTKILCNQISNRRRGGTINNVKVEVLPVSECAKYLGQTLHFSNRKQQKSGVEFELLGRRSTGTSRS